MLDIEVVPNVETARSFHLERERAAFFSVVSIVEAAVGQSLVDRSEVRSENDLRAVLPQEGSEFLAFLAGDADWHPRILRPALKADCRETIVVQAILQIAEMYKKVFEVCAQDRIDDAVEKYHFDEADLRRLSLPHDEVEQTARYIISYVLGRAPRFIPWVAGHFGPGACAEGLNHVERFSAPVSWDLIDVIDVIDAPECLERSITFGPQSPSRMIAVPKTFEKPRLIAAEPAWNSWFQQALGDILRRKMCRYACLDISNQDRNGYLSMEDGFGTIDQSRASDRVSNELVRALFGHDWFRLLDAVRTPSVDCLCGDNHVLAKFAGMGSATTFPVETLIFAAIAMASMAVTDGLVIDHPDRVALLFSLYGDQVGFYGDDAVVPTAYVDTVCADYERFGFIVNTEKSYAYGPFKESCGVYSFMGVDVTPTRRRRLLSTESDAVSMAAATSFYNGIVLRWSDQVDNELFKQLAISLGITGIPVVPYCIDYSHPKPTLYRYGPGFGRFSGIPEVDRGWDLFPKTRYAALSGRRRSYHVTDSSAAAVVYLCLSDAGRQLPPKSLSQRFSPRPDALRLRLRS